MEDCIFCQIVSGKMPAQKIYEDDKTLAFLTIQPIRPGHTLIIPKLHNPDIFALPKEEYLAVMNTAFNLTPVLKAAYKPKRVGSFVTGWDVPHAHFHLVPLQDNHDITSERLLNGKAVVVEQSELELQLKRIIAELT